MAYVPRSPLRLDPVKLRRRRVRFGGSMVLAGLIGAAMLAGAGYFGARVLRERDVWRHGVPGRIAAVSGHVTKHGEWGVTIVYAYELQVRFIDAGGAIHTVEHEFDSVWSEINATPEVQLRYDPQDPSRIALLLTPSWATRLAPEGHQSGQSAVQAARRGAGRSAVRGCATLASRSGKDPHRRRRPRALRGGRRGAGGPSA